MLVKMSPRLKNTSDTENDSNTTRSRFRQESSRRKSARPTRNTRQNASQIGHDVIVFPPKNPSIPRAILQYTCGPV
jgi:hypothetical protein